MRNYSSTAVATELASSITSSDTIATLKAATGLPSVPFTLVLAPDTSDEEIVTVTARSGTSITAMSRGQESTTARSHAADTVVKHMVTGRDLQDAQDHIADSTGVHGVTGSVVGTEGSQTLIGKSISGSANSLSNIPQSAVTNLVTDLSNKASSTHTHLLAGVTDVTASASEVNVLDGITASTAELNILDGVTASAAELNILDGATLSTTELNYVDGVTSSIQTQLSGKASSSHTHAISDVTGLQTALDDKASVSGTYAYFYTTSSQVSSGAITFGSETYDSSNGHSTSSSTERFTPTVAGYYFVSYGLNFTTADTSGAGFSIYKSGTQVSGSIMNVDPNASGINIPVHLTAIVYLNGSTDYVNCFVSMVSGTIGTRNATIFKISN